MLSYRHSFHAGNFTDIIKHIVLVEILDYLNQKATLFDYIDTHAGAGLYNLKSDHASKLEEYSSGIRKLTMNDFPELTRYFEVIHTYNQPGTMTIYPGSPSIAACFLRPQDRAWLYELLPGLSIYFLDVISFMVNSNKPDHKVIVAGMIINDSKIEKRFSAFFGKGTIDLSSAEST